MISYCFIDPATDTIMMNRSNSVRPGTIKTFKQLEKKDFLRDVRARRSLSSAISFYEMFLINNAKHFDHIPQQIHIVRCRENWKKSEMVITISSKEPFRIMDKDDHRWTILFYDVLIRVAVKGSVSQMADSGKPFFKAFYNRKDKDDFKYLCYGRKQNWVNKNVRTGFFNGSNTIAYGEWLAIKDEQTMVMARLSFDIDEVISMEDLKNV